MLVTKVPVIRSSRLHVATRMAYSRSHEGFMKQSSNSVALELPVGSLRTLQFEPDPLAVNQDKSGIDQLLAGDVVLRIAA